MLANVRGTYSVRRFDVARHCRCLQLLLVGVLCLVGVVALLPWRPGLVVGHSMEPTLRHGTVFLYDRSYYQHHPVIPGDVVVVRHRNEVWIKRVYAGAGANFWALRYGGNEAMRHDPIRVAAQRRFVQVAARLRSAYGVDYRVVPMRIPPEYVFLVGDGATSEDSRAFGLVPTDEILGRVVALPGQRLGDIPDWVELSTPRLQRAAKRTGRTQGRG